jgi:ferredoxin
MIVNYGYTDGSGDFYITIDTDKCDSCGKCIEVCPEKVFGIEEDDYGKSVAVVKESLRSKIGYTCRSFALCSVELKDHCHGVCEPGAISHTW